MINGLFEAVSEEEMLFVNGACGGDAPSPGNTKAYAPSTPSTCDKWISYGNQVMTNAAILAPAMNNVPYGGQMVSVYAAFGGICTTIGSIMNK